jgi:Protein of unknown function (DUF3152)
VRGRDVVGTFVAAALAIVVTACARPTGERDDGASPAAPDAGGPATAFQAAAPPPPAPPTGGSGAYAVAAGTGPVVGAGTIRIRYRVEVETGIAWGANPVWTPADFATRVEEIVAAPRGWTASAAAPVTDASVRLTRASWSFQRVAGGAFEVRLRLATTATVERECGVNGVDVTGGYSCRFGQTLMINLGRWLNGVEGYPVDIDDYRTSVINHELGHFLGFDHMTCPAPGRPAPVMQTQTIDLGGCTPNVYPFAADGTFVTGPWKAS